MFGTLLKQWRLSRGLSQLSLSHQADISAKHLSFLETGRAQPSREMILRLGMSMDIPLAERNHMLITAGYTEAYSRLTLDHPTMQPVKNALTHMLENHEPYPAMVFDWNWQILMSNRTHQALFRALAQQQPDFPETLNIAELTCHPQGFKPFIENWDEVASLIIQRIQRERTANGDRRSDLLDRLLNLPGMPDKLQRLPLDQPAKPMVDLKLRVFNQRLSLFSTLSTFGTPIDVTMEELTIEQYFPTDDATRAFFERGVVWEMS